MMPVVKGKPATRLQILTYTALLLPLGLVPVLIGLGGALYAFSAVLFGGWMLVDAVAVWRERDGTREPAARKLFGISILYLFALFAALIVERAMHIPPFALLALGGWT